MDREGKGMDREGEGQGRGGREGGREGQTTTDSRTNERTKSNNVVINSYTLPKKMDVEIVRRLLFVLGYVDCTSKIIKTREHIEEG